MSNSLSTNSFSAARAAATIPTTTPQIGDTEEMLLAKQLKLALAGGSDGGMPIPVHDYVGVTYFGATNNIQTVVFKTGGSGGTTVGTLTLAYSGGGAADNDRLTSATLT